MDEDGDRKIDRSEFRKAIPLLSISPAPTEAEVDAYFDAMDADGGGTMDVDEFQSFLSKEAEVLGAEKGVTEKPVAPPPPTKNGQKPPDNASLSKALVAMVTFICADFVTFLQINASFVSSMPTLDWPYADAREAETQDKKVEISSPS